MPLTDQAGRRAADEALASGDRALGGRMLVDWAATREEANPQEALEGYKEAAVILGDFDDEVNTSHAAEAWRNIATSYIQLHQQALPASLAWKKYAELSLMGTAHMAKLQSGGALAGASTWSAQLGDAAGSTALAARSLRCFAAFLQHYVPAAPAYKETKPSTFQHLYTQAKAVGQCAAFDLHACRGSSAAMWLVLAMSALEADKFDRAKRQAEAAIWLSTEAASSPDENDEGMAVNGCRAIWAANASLARDNGDNKKVPTPAFDRYVAGKPASFLGNLFGQGGR